MARLAMLRPYAIVTANGSGITNPSRALTPDPKEAAFWNGGNASIFFDLGAPLPVDTFFAGFTGPVAYNVYHSADAVTYAAMPGLPSPALRADDVPPDLINPAYHAVTIFPAPITARYFAFDGTFPANTPLGVVAIGRSFVSQFGHEWNAGRPVEDTGTADRLKSGGFGIEEGVRIGGYQWTFGDLTDAELRTLYAFTRDRGTTRPTLIVEDTDRTAGIHERIHWGLLDRIEAYERLAPGLSRYNLRIRDWV